jgi:hypothetical protein
VLLATLIHQYQFKLAYLEWEQERREVFNLIPGRLPLEDSRRFSWLDGKFLVGA